MNAALGVAGGALAIAMVIAMLLGASRLREAGRTDFIRGYGFPKGLIEKLQERHPGLSAKDAQLVARGLRHFFLAHLKSGRRFVSMPSQIAGSRPSSSSGIRAPPLTILGGNTSS